MRSRRIEIVLAIAAVALALAPLIVAILSRAGSDWLPTHDVAVTDMRVRDVWTADAPLVGPYSRYLWNHPGPVMYWMMAVPSALSGQAAWGTLVGGVIVQAVAVVWAGLIAWRSGRLPVVLLTMGTVLLTFRAIGPLVILEPWNPHVALPWFVLFVLYAWRLSVGELRRLPGAFFVASFLVQTHVGYLPLVAAAGAVVSTYLLVDWRRSQLDAVGRRTYVLTAVIGVVLWTPVLVDQLTSSTGNLTRLARYFLGDGSGETTAGLRAATGLAGAAFAVPPPWLGGEESRNFLTQSLQPASPWLVAVPLSLLALGIGGAVTARRRDHQRYVVLVAAVFGAGVVALSRITGELLEYLFYWRTPLAAMVLIAGGLGLGDLLASRRERASSSSPRPVSVALGPIAAALVIVVLLAMSITTSAAVATHGSEVRSFEREVAAVLGQIDADEIDGRVMVRFDGSTLGGLQGGVVDALDRMGADVRVDDELGFQFGEHRVASTDEVDEIWYALEDGLLTSLRATDTNGRVVARLVPLGAEVEAEMVALQLRLYRQLIDAGHLELAGALDSELVALLLHDVPGIDAADTARLAELNADVRSSGSCRCSVVAFDPAAAPRAASWK